MTSNYRFESYPAIEGPIAGTEMDDFAAELTEAAFGVALRHGVGSDWLDRKLELWNAMSNTVRAWNQPTPATIRSN